MSDKHTSDKIGKEAAHEYERHVKSFARSPLRDVAAEDARRAVDGPEGEQLFRAEQQGKSRSAGEDRDAMVPDWLTERQQSAWQRIKTALKRDWEQTVNHFAPKRAPHLGQSAGDTVKQALGMEEVPAGEQPNRPDVETRWEEVEPAVRLGHAASTHYDDREWSPDLESRLRRDWEAMRPQVAWHRVSQHVRYGWSYERDRGKR